MSEIFIKIHQGTGRLTGISLCRSCRYGHMVTDARGDQMRCNMSDMRIRGVVTECNRYYNSTLPSLDDLYQSAWTLKTEKGGRSIGFTPPDHDVSQAPARIR